MIHLILLGLMQSKLALTSPGYILFPRLSVYCARAGLDIETESRLRRKNHDLYDRRSLQSVWRYVRPPEKANNHVKWKVSLNPQASLLDLLFLMVLVVIPQKVTQAMATVSRPWPTRAVSACYKAEAIL